jgi:hypothetical protein
VTTDKRDTPAAATTDRRANARVKLTPPLTARRIGGGDSFAIEEASIGGFSIKSPVPFEPDSVHQFRISNAGGQWAIVSAACRYCTVPDSSEPSSHLVGFQFLPQPTRRLRIVLGAIAIDAP